MSIKAHPQRTALELGPVFKMHKVKFSFMPMVIKWPGKPMGHKSYAKKQQKLWKAFERKSLERFALYLP